MIDAGLGRKTINERIRRCRRFVKWCIVNKGVDHVVLLPWQAIGPLQYGRTEAIEHPPVMSVNLEDIELTIQHLSDVMQRMVRLHLATGMRSTELCTMRWVDINRVSSTWIYTPREHKTEHHGHRRNVPIHETFITICLVISVRRLFS